MFGPEPPAPGPPSPVLGTLPQRPRQTKTTGIPGGGALREHSDKAEQTPRGCPQGAPVTEKGGDEYLLYGCHLADSVLTLGTADT